MSSRVTIGRIVLVGAWCALLPASLHAQPTTTRVSLSSAGAQGNLETVNPAISLDGRWVTFVSTASNLVPDDTNGTWDIFVRDLQTGWTSRVNLGPGGAQAIGGDGSWFPALSADGRWVTFQSWAANLVPGDTNNAPDVFVHDRQTGLTTRVSVGSDGTQSNGNSYTSAISADGRWVVFDSYASNLVPDDTNGASDVFLHDRQTGSTTRVSVGTGDVQGNNHSNQPSMSADGRWIAFDSFADNLVPADTDRNWDVFVHDRETGTTTRVSVGSGGIEGNHGSGGASISADGRWVAFVSPASNLVPGDSNNRIDVFVHDRQTVTTTRVSVGPGGTQADGHSWNAAISADGGSVAFASEASTLVQGDTNGFQDVFVHDRHTGTTARVSIGPGGVQGDDDSGTGIPANPVPSISGNGRFVTFGSEATNLVADDTNGVSDAFIHDRGDPGCLITLVPPTTLVSAAGAAGNVTVVAAADCGWTAVSNDPSWLTVTSGESGIGNGTVSYSVATNGGGPRAGTLTIGGATFTVNQASDATPLPPGGLHAHTIVGNVVTLRWSIPSGGVPATGFVVEGGLNPGEVLASLPTGSADPTFSFTAPTGSFYVRVHALNGAIRSAASNEIRIHINVPVPPSAPTGVLGLVNGSDLALAWTNTYEGGAPASLVLDVTGTIAASLPLGLVDSFSFSGVPPGTYTLAVRALNAGGSSPSSNSVTLTFPGPCTGPPLVPANLLAYRVGSTVFVDWAPAASGPAPTSYVLHVIGAFTGDFPTAGRALSGTVGPGAYTLSVEAVNACGASGSTVTQTVLVP